MKKIFLTILVVASMVSCSNDDVVSIAPRKAITFGNVFIENSTRAADFHTTDELDKFFVYGTVTGSLGSGNTVNLYEGATVTKSSGVWDCNVTQYWVPECHYNFVAISDVTATVPVTDNTTVGAVVVKTDDNGMPTEIKYDASSQKDLLYAKIQSPIDTDANADPTSGTDNNGNVKFTFEHLLSKVMFTFTNGFSMESGVKLYITDIKITNAAKQAIYTCSSTPSWKVSTNFTGADDDDCLSFGETVDINPTMTGKNSIDCLLIPETKKFEISIKINHYLGGESTTRTLTTTQELTLLPGHFYNFTTELNSSNVEGIVPIEFNIKDDTTWEEEGPQKDINVNDDITSN